MRRRMPVAGFAGYSGSGKTTLICGILDLLTKKSLRIGVIKHHGHGTDSDLDGIMKDTELFQRHGAAFVQLLVGGEQPEPVLDSLEEEPLDLILVEGFKKSSLPKFLVKRTGAEGPDFIPENLLGVISEDPEDRIGTLPWFHSNDLIGIAGYIEKEILAIIERSINRMVNITLNGQKMEVSKDKTILAIARENGIDIPTLCHNQKLKTFAGCRMCVVEITGRKNLASSCSTKPLEGMVIQTHSDKVMKARKDILDLLISNHPMDCLTCSSVGNCTLQDLSFEYKVKVGTYLGEKKHYEIDDANPAYITDADKCILCGKCVNTCDQIQISHTIDFRGKGFRTKVSPAYGLPISTDNCRLCGQCVSACPTGALTHKMFQNVRPWKVRKVRTTCPFCGTGCNFDLNVVDGKVVGVTPIEEATVNSTSLCVKGRYHTDMLNSPDRLTTPLIKKDGEFVAVSYEEALDYVATRIGEIKETYGPDSIAGLASARCTNEDNYILQKLFRVGFGTNNIDHCART